MVHLHAAANATLPKHEDADREARLTLLAIWQVRDQNTAQYFGVAIVGLITFLTAWHWLEHLFNKRFSRWDNFHRRTRTITRLLRRFDKATVLGGASLQPGTISLAFFYFGINATLTFYDHPERAGSAIIAKRFGWLSLCNLCLTVFLALKNTPLSLLAGRSFDRVNSVHRYCGFVAILFAMLHSTYVEVCVSTGQCSPVHRTYIYGLSTFGAMERVLTEPQQYAGAVACLSMLLILVTAISFVRRRQYEMFYAVHVAMTAVVLVAVALHRPSISKKAFIITIISSGMWLADKALRLSRWIYHGAGNYCTLKPLAREATRVTMHRHMAAQPGSMAFLWVPGVKMLQQHPFTLLSTTPATFIVQAQEGFTKELYLAACSSPGIKYRASIEGPYCTVPDTRDYDKLVLIAGGTGATFTIAIALEWARRHHIPTLSSTLDFVWIVRNGACLEWLDVELSDLRAHPQASVSLYVSSADSRRDEMNCPSGDIRPPQESTDSFDSKELHSWSDDASERMTRDASSRQPTPFLESIPSYKTGRPDLPGLIRYGLSGLGIDDKVLVAGCGSKALLQNVRQAVDQCRVVSTPSIKVHLEQFSL